MGQTMVRIVAPGRKTISPKGVKQVTVTHPPGDKEGLTLNSTIKADGTTLAAEILFKTSAKGGKPSDSFVGKLDAPENVIIKSAPKAWWNGLFDFEYIETAFPVYQEFTVLLRDNFSVHKSQQSVEKLEARNVHQIAIPPGMTGRWQPLDVSRKWSFKEAFKEEYRHWQRNKISFFNSGNLRKPGKKEFVTFVSIAWDNIKPEAVENSFYAAQILRKDDSFVNVAAGETVEQDNNILDCSFFN
ncbi:hypothetical protein RvY_12221 [Ramazzottius varieornatus]|uniref:DDE-1 domain-containing protein n=1 Tax=Ramazzottius varieornatus TaxID=947166 RepID=A0A1D1VIS5_RAMVA|nr:hypothetical protein RvY_12221 [Ramazzottius varieornatus]